MIKPKQARSTVGFVKSPNAIYVDGSETIIPAFLKPIKAIKNPIPAPIANFIFLGIEFIIAFLIPVTEIIKKIIPEIKTAAKASCQEYPKVKQAVYVKKAFTPIPGAKPIG